MMRSVDPSPELLDAVRDGVGTRVVSSAPLRESDDRPVWRMGLADGASVVVKAVMQSDRTEELWANVRSDAAALQLAAGSGVAPELVFLDEGGRLFVQEDLGIGRSLADLLLADDADAASAGLGAFATSLGRLHGATVGTAGQPRRLLFGSPVAALQNLRPVLSELGIDISDAAVGDAEVINHEIAEPGPWRALVHGDACPDNTLLRADGTVAFFDFEMGGGGHALLDTVYLHLPFPSCWCANRIPAPVISGAEAAYRAAAPTVANDSFAAGLASCAGAGALTTVDWHLQRMLGRDSPWGIATVRQRPAVRLRAFSDLAHRADRFSALATLARHLADVLEARWGDLEPLPLYPAFR